MTTTERKIANRIVIAWACTLIIGILMGHTVSWVLALLHSVFMMCAGGYFFMILVDYQDKVGRDAHGVEKVLNPFITMINACCVMAVLHGVVGIWSITAVIMNTFILCFSLYGRRIRWRFDATRLWKDIDNAIFDAKIMLGLACVHFIVMVVALIVNIVGSL
eukprot:Tbor_TRINITY_DN2569_c0_g1::TRINITY_DN2569_c0_g1_i1::g.552::m.552